MQSPAQVPVPLPADVATAPGTSLGEQSSDRLSPARPPPEDGPSALPERSLLPLCVDLDGTLLKTDTLWESLIACLKRRPWQALWVPAWLFRGKAQLKCRLAQAGPLDYATLPCTTEVLDFLRRAQAAGRPLVLVSGCDQSIAQGVAQELRLFGEVLASDGQTNLKGAAKARLLAERFGLRGFDYLGNDQADIPVWAAARGRLLANAPPKLVRRLEREDKAVHEIAPRPRRFPALVRALRCHQWSKNLLVFLPLVAAHAYFDWPAVTGALLMFLAWCAAASGIYVANDLLDLEADRSHPTKRRRPFASADLPLTLGFGLAPGLLALGLGLAASISGGCLAALLGYVGCAFAYSWHLKKRSLVDVFTLAFLFTVRVVGGGLASGYPVTMWLLAFSGFLFLGLAFLKRCSELVRIQELGRRHLGSRGYGVADQPVLEMFGVASAFTAIMVLGLYLNSAVAETHYRWPTALWAEAPFLLLWLCRLWLATARGEMDDDPIVYSMKDWVSWLLGGCVLAAFIVATTG